MDASRYLRLKTASCPQTIARSRCIEAGLRTEMLGKAATTTYISPNAMTNNPDVPVQSECCTNYIEPGGLNPVPKTMITTRIGFGGDYVQPINPPKGCEWSAMCNDITNRYSDPFIILPGCPYPATASTLTEVGGGRVISKVCACYQCTPLLASQREADYLCTCPTNAEPAPAPAPPGPPPSGVVTFTSVGTTSWTAPNGISTINVLVVGGGGGGGASYALTNGEGSNGNPSRGGPSGGGGGGGQVITNETYTVVPGNTYTVTVGGGGAGGTATLTSETAASQGDNSVFDTIIAYGGGRGYSSRDFRNCATPPYAGQPYCGSFRGGPTSDIGITPGNPPGGGNGGTYNGSPDYLLGGGGGGGAGTAGTSGNYGPSNASGGGGIDSTISGSDVYYGAGGQGGSAGGIEGANDPGTVTPVNIGRGGDGVGAGPNGFVNGQNGGSGIVIIQYGA